MGSISIFSLFILVGASCIVLISAARDTEGPDSLEVHDQHGPSEEEHHGPSEASGRASAVTINSPMADSSPPESAADAPRRVAHWPQFTEGTQREATLMWMLVSVAFTTLGVKQREFQVQTAADCMSKIFPGAMLPHGITPDAIEYITEFSATINDTATETAALIVKMSSATDPRTKDIVIVHPGTCGHPLKSTHLARQLTKQATQFLWSPVDITDQGGTVVGNALRYWSRAQANLDQAVADTVLALTEHGDWSHRIVVAGFSLGGAVATIEAASLLRRRGQIFAKTGGTPHMSVYMFGAPRAADQNFAGYVDSLMAFEDVQWWRIVNGADPVSAFPAKGRRGRVHHGIEVWYNGVEPIVDVRPLEERLRDSTENQAMSASVGSTSPRDHLTYMGQKANLCDKTCDSAGEDVERLADMV